MFRYSGAFRESPGRLDSGATPALLASFHSAAVLGASTVAETAASFSPTQHKPRASPTDWAPRSLRSLWYSSLARCLSTRIARWLDAARHKPGGALLRVVSVANSRNDLRARDDRANSFERRSAPLVITRELRSLEPRGSRLGRVWFSGPGGMKGRGLSELPPDNTHNGTDHSSLEQRTLIKSPSDQGP